MKGTNIVEQFHIVPMTSSHFTAATGTSTITSEFFDMEDAARASILIHIGTVSDTLTLTVLESTSSSAGDGTAIAFTLYPEEDTGGDVFDSKTAGSASGYQLGGTANTMYVVDITADQLTDGSNWLGFQVAGVGTTGSIIVSQAYLTGYRHQVQLSATQTS